jgi:putative tricarboxylic transport membrane protein
MKETLRELGLAAVLVAVGVFALIATSMIQVGAIVVDPLGPAKYPQLLALIFLVLSLLYLGGEIIKLVRLRRNKAAAEEADAAELAEDDPERPVSLVRPILVVVALVGYVLVLETIGYVLATALLLMAIHIVFGIRRRWWLAAIISIASAVLLKLFFGELLLVPLPTGPWGF